MYIQRTIRLMKSRILSTSSKTTFCFLMLFPLRLFCQQNDSLEWFVRKQVRDYAIPALAVGVIKNNTVLWSQGYTLRADTIRTTDRSIFPIMSCTKAFTATAIGILVDHGKLHWNDKIIDYLPDFRLRDRTVTKAITIRDLLSHTSGLESYEGDLLWYGTNYTRNEIVHRIRYSPVRYKRGRDYGYNNIMYLVAGQLIEKVTGRKWENFIREKIIRPLNLDSTITTDYLYNIAPAGAIQSNVKDMLTWMNCWMNEGKRLLSKSSFEEIIRPHIAVTKNGDVHYGMGWQIEGDSSGKVISHGGGMPGFKSLVTIDLNRKLGVVILSNRITYLNEELTSVVMRYLSGEPVNWQQEDKNLLSKNVHFSWDDRNFAQVAPPAAFKAYEGTYEDVQYGKVVIATIGVTAVMEFLPALTSYKGYLTYVNTDTMRIDFNDPFIPSGKVIFNRRHDQLSGFKLDIPPGDFIFSSLFFRRMIDKQY